jgi:hypothetical protein
MRTNNRWSAWSADGVFDFTIGWLWAWPLRLAAGRPTVVKVLSMLVFVVWFPFGISLSVPVLLVTIPPILIAGLWEGMEDRW